MMGMLGALWGIGGIVLLLLAAIVRLTPIAFEALSNPMHWGHWLSLLLVVAFMAQAEGYRGFQKAFSPRAAARARFLQQNPQVLHVALAPFFCMGYFHATRKRQISSICLTCGIVLLILGVRLLPQPWRGIIDAGVVVGLAWGLVSLLIFAVKALGPGPFPYSPETPENR